MFWETLAHVFHLRRGGIRRRLLGTGLVLLGLSLFLSTLAGSVYSYFQIKRSAARIQSEVGRRVALEIGTFLQQKVERLTDFAAVTGLHDPGSQEQRLLALLLLRNDEAFTQVSVLNLDGQEILEVSERKLFLPREYRNRKQEPDFLEARGGRNYISPVTTSDKAEPYVNLAVPIWFGPEEVVGVVTAELHLRFLWKVLGEIKFGTGGYAYLVDQRGSLIAHRDPSAVLAGRFLDRLSKVENFLAAPKFADARPGQKVQGIFGQSVLSTYTPIPSVGWAVVLEEPVGEALADVKEVIFYASLLLIGGLAVGTVVIAWASDRITTPVSKLHRGVQFIAGGDLDHRVEIKTGDEIEKLAEEFNHMAEKLKASYETLEHKVAQRTSELSALYDIVAISNRSLDLDKVLKEVIQKITEIFRFDATRIFLYAPNLDELILRASFAARSDSFPDRNAFKRGEGIVGKVAETGEPIIFEDAQEDPRYCAMSQTKHLKKTGYRFLAVFPIKAKTKSIGTLICIGRGSRKLTNEEIRLLLSLGDHVGVAVMNATLYQETLSRARGLSALYSVAALVSQSLDINDLLGTVMRKVLGIFEFDAARTYLIDSERKELRLVGQVGFPDSVVPAPSYKPGGGIVGRVFEREQPMIFEDIQESAEFHRMAANKIILKAGYRGHFCIPLGIKGKTVGAMNFITKERRRFSSDEVRLIHSIATHVGMAVENAKLYGEAVHRSQQISAVHAVSATVGQTLELKEIFQQGLEKLCEVLGFEGGRLFFLPPHSNELSIRAHVGLHEEMVQVAPYRLGDGVVGKVAQTGESITIEDLRESEEFLRYSRSGKSGLDHHRFRASAYFPMKAREKTLGVIHLCSLSTHRFTEEEHRLIESMTGQIAIALENALLFEEIKRQTSALEEANRELQAANRAKSEFLASMSHELRTPLNVIIGNIGLAQEGFFGRVSKKQRESFEKIHRYSEMLLKMVNDVLTLAKMDAKKMTLKLSTVPIDDILNSVRSYTDHLNHGKRLEFLWRVENNLPPLTTDVLKLEEILQNLIGNAFKFTPEGQIRIQVRNLKQKKRVEFTVADSGIGIERGELEKIFDEFHQLREAHTGNYSGVGLGLSIVRKYLELMRGEIQVQSEVGKGTIFTFTLPYSC